MRTKLSAMTAVAVVPAAMLSIGIGTAQAAGIWVDVIAGAGGATTVVHSWGAPNGPDPAPSGTCNYSAFPEGNPWGKPLPAVNWPFYLPENGEGSVWFPSFPTGSTWDIKVDCPNGTFFAKAVW